MLNLTGTVINVFTQQGGTNKKGESFEDRDKVQLLGALDLPNGGIKNDFKDLLNQKISIPVGVMAMGRNVIFYVAKGAQPQIVQA